jgi:uncharacterized protein YkwD
VNRFLPLRAPAALAALVLAGACAFTGTLPAEPPPSTPPAAPAPPAPPRQPAASADPLAEFVGLLNRHRVRVGCAELQWHETAARVAQAHSADMARRGYFDHVSPEGVGMRARLQAAGVTARPAAENLVDAPFGGERLLARWLASPIHRANIEDCGFTHHALARSGDLWTHLFLAVPAARAGGARR